MNGDLRIDVSGLNLDQVSRRLEAAIPEAVGAAMEHVLSVAAPKVPVETGRLVGSGTVHVDGDTASITFDGPYARYQHERMDLRHDHGQAKFLEEPMATEEQTTLQIAATTLKRAL